MSKDNKERQLILENEGTALRTALCRVITQRVRLISYRRFGTKHRSQFQDFVKLTMGWIGCPETSVRNYPLPAA